MKDLAQDRACDYVLSQYKVSEIRDSVNITGDTRHLFTFCIDFYIFEDRARKNV